MPNAMTTRQAAGLRRRLVMETPRGLDSLRKGLVAFWKLDELSDGLSPVTRLDVVGGNDLTDVNTVASAGAVVGPGATYEDVNFEYLVRSRAAGIGNLSPGNNSFAVSAFLNLSTTASTRAAVAVYRTSDNNREWMLGHVRSPDRFKFWCSGDGTSAETRSITADALGDTAIATWYHVVGQYDKVADRMELWIDGQLDTSADANLQPGGLFQGGADIGLGRYQSAGYWDGVIDCVGFWFGRILTAEEIGHLYNDGNGREFPF